MLKGAIFDFDGTIVDSMYIWDNISMDYLRSLGIEPRENLNEVFANFSLEQAAKYYRDNYKVTLSVNEIISGVNEMIKEFYRTKVTLKKGIENYLSYLGGRGTKICIATLTDREIVIETLERLGVMKHFSEVFDCNEYPNGKNTPELYNTALNQLGTQKDETYVFEDALYALKTAKNAGFPTVAVFDKYEPLQKELESISDIYISDYTDTRLYTI